MQNTLLWIQIIASIFLIVSVLFQDSKNAPQSSYGVNSNVYFKPRGKEAFFGNLTKISATVLFIVSIISLIVK